MLLSEQTTSQLRRSQKKTSWQDTKAPARDAAHKFSLSHRSAIRSRPYTTPGGHDEQIIPAYGQPRHLQRVWSCQCRPNGVVFGTNSPKVRQKLISKISPLTLNKAVEIAWSFKTSQAQLPAMAAGPAAAHRSSTTVLLLYLLSTKGNHWSILPCHGHPRFSHHRPPDFQWLEAIHIQLF